MKFGVAISGNISQEQTNMIVDLEDTIKQGLATKTYGTSVESLLIGFICVAPQFDSFFKKGRPRYSLGSKTVIEHGFSMTITNQFEYDIKMDFDPFVKSSVGKARGLLIAELGNSLSNFDAHKKKFKDFDLDSFKRDFREILRLQVGASTEASQNHNQTPTITKDQTTMTNLDSALAQFKECSIKHVATIGATAPGASGDSYQKLLEAVNYLKERDEIQQLEKLVDHPEQSVQLMAASFLLPFESTVAVEMLDRISNREGKESFIARMLLQDIKGGNL